MLLVFLSFGFINSALASDHWDTCSSSDAYAKIENGYAAVNGEEATVTKMAVIQKIKEEQNKCILKNSGSEVISYMNTITVEEAQIIHSGNKYPDVFTVICERGGSGIPANDECKP